MRVDRDPPLYYLRTKNLRSRWRQENDFKYLREHYAVDQIIQYGADEETRDRLVLNPRRKAIITRAGVMTLRQRSDTAVGSPRARADLTERPAVRAGPR